MPIELYTPTVSDARRLTDLLYDGYADDPASACMYPVPASEAMRVSSTQKVEKSWSQTPNEKRIVARDTELGKSISYIQYFIEPQKPEDNDDWKNPPDVTSWVEDDWDKEWVAASTRRNVEMRVKIMGRAPYIHFQSLVTPPEYRKRGAGSALVEALVKYASSANLPVYLTATPKGEQLYRKFGFKQRETYMQDVSKVTGQPRELKCMVLAAPHPDQAPSLPPLILPITTLEDYLEFANIANRAFDVYEISELAFGGSKGTEESKLERAQKEFNMVAESLKPENKDKLGHMYHKAVDPITGKTIGCSKWYFVYDPSMKHEPFGPWPPTANIELCEAHFGEINRLRERTMAKEKHVLMCVLIADPSAQRRGVGSALLREGLKIADEMGVRAWIDASPQGLGLYKKFGWEEVNTHTTDLKKWGGTTHDTTVSLIRKPGAKMP